MDSEIRSASAKRRHMDWQDRSLSYTENVPEAWYACLFYGRALPKLKFVAGEQQWNAATGEMEVVPTSNQKAIDGLKRLMSPGGGMRNFLEKYGQLQYATGEGYAVGMTPKGEGSSVEEWTFRSHQEVRIHPSKTNTYQLLDMPGAKPEEVAAASDNDWSDIEPGKAIVARFWRSSMRHSWMPDAPMRPVLDTAEELLLLTQSIHARATSRAAGPGILYVPQSIASQVPALPDATPDEANMPPVMQLLARGMMTAVANPNHASAVVPILLTGPDDAGDKIKHIAIYDNSTEWPEIANRKAAVERFAGGSDFPIEYLLGLSDTNHWNAWEISDDIWQMHLQPVAVGLADDMAQALWRPILRSMGVPDPDMFAILIDESEVVTRPDKTGAALDGYKAGIVRGAAYRREAGFDESDAMDDDEYKRWVGVQMNDPSLATGGDITAPPPQMVFGHPAGQQQNGNGDTADNAPPAEPVRSGDGGSESARVLGAVAMAVMVAREKAGARVWQKIRGCDDCKLRVAGAPKRNLAAALGEDGATGMSLPAARDLVAGADEVLMQTLLSWGVELPQAAWLSARVTDYAAETLWEVDPPSVPPEVVRMVEGVAS